ncbi:hypothetical protein ABT040_15195 [Streptomyces sp. NPDC002688]
MTGDAPVTGADGKPGREPVSLLTVLQVVDDGRGRPTWAGASPTG